MVAPRSITRALLVQDRWQPRQVEFAGREQLVEQWRGALVRTIDEDGCFEVRPASGAPPCATKYRIPVEGESTDAENSAVHALVHVDDEGYLKEVEFYSDSGVVRSPVDPKTMNVFAPPWRP